MQCSSLLSPARTAALLVTCGCAAMAAAQNTPASASSAANNDWMAQTAKMYYSSSKAGLKGFDCALKPDWRAFFASKSGGDVKASDEPAVTLLNSVKTAVHARMDGGSIIDWDPPAQQLDSTQTALLSQMHGALNQMVQGFMQFWSPFIESQVVPDTAEGLEMTTTADGGRQFHVATPQVEVTETFDSGHVLRQYNVTMSGTRIQMTPAYTADSHGLLITHFHAFVEPMNDPQKNMEMNVDVNYQWLENFPVPAQLNMDVVGVAGLNIGFANCTVQH